MAMSKEASFRYLFLGTSLLDLSLTPLLSARKEGNGENEEITGEGDVIPLGRNKEKTWVLLSATSRTQKNWLVGTEHPENSLEKANGITGHTDNLSPYFNVDLSSKYVHVTTKEEREREGKKSECESEKQNSCPRIHLKWVEKIGRENSI